MTQIRDDESIYKELMDRLSSGESIRRAIHKPAKRALEDHIRTGDPVAGWRDGKVVWIPAEEIQIEEIGEP